MKIPTVDFTDETLAIHDTYGNDVREIMVLVMDVDKVADEVTNTVAEIPNEDLVMDMEWRLTRWLMRLLQMLKHFQSKTMSAVERCVNQVSAWSGVNFSC